MPMSQSFSNRLFPLLPSIIEDYGYNTPFHIYDEMGIMETCNRLKLYLRTPGFQEFFAVKALPDPAILRIMHNAGFGFDCSSITELILAKQAGATPDQIMFTSNNTTNKELEFALDMNVLLNLDDVSFLEKPIVRERMPELICFRLNPGNRQTGNSIIGKPTEAKYGIMWEELVPAYRRAQELGATRFGLHTMIASNDLDYEHVLVNVDILLEAASLLKKELGIEVEFTNIGGGIGTPYKPDQDEFDLPAFGYVITQKFQEFREQNGFEPKLFTELGRYMTGPHGVLVTRAINCKRTYQTHVGVEIAMPALMRPAMYDAYHEITVVDRDGNPVITDETEVVNIVGPICENCDRLATQRLLPKIYCDEHEGDFIIVHNTGAHGSAMGFNYNGRTRPKGLLLGRDGKIRMTRREETFEDLLRTTQGL